MDYADDNTPDHSLYDPTGVQLGAWINEMSTYIKSLDRMHMVSPGSEGHGFPNKAENPDLNNYWARTNEGYGTDPIAVMDQPNIDFFTFHPYPNETWCKYSLQEISKSDYGLIKVYQMYHHKPIVMQEWAISKLKPLKDPNNNNQEMLPTDPNFAALRLEWCEDMMKTFREAGGNGWNIWALQVNQTETESGVSLYNPGSQVIQDRPLVQAMINESKLFIQKTGWDLDK